MPNVEHREQERASCGCKKSAGPPDKAAGIHVKCMLGVGYVTTDQGYVPIGGWCVRACALASWQSRPGARGVGPGQRACTGRLARWLGRDPGRAKKWPGTT